MKKTIIFFITATILSLPINTLACKNPLPPILQQALLAINLINTAKKLLNIPKQTVAHTAIHQEQKHTFVDKNYSDIYLELMKNSNPNLGPVLCGGSLELHAIADKYKIRINIINIDKHGKQTLLTTLGDSESEITIQQQDGYYKYFDYTQQLIDVPHDENCILNAVLGAINSNEFNENIFTNIDQFRKDIVEYLQNDPNTPQNLNNLRAAGIIETTHNIEQIVNNLLMSQSPIDHSIINNIIIKALQKQIDNNLTFEFIKKAAMQGNKHAQNSLGTCYIHSIGTKKNKEEAVKWFIKAAEQGEIKSQYNLGVCYFSGIGTKKNIEQAIKYYTQAAEQGYVKAQFNLGTIYCYDTGFSIQDYNKAIMWFTKAAEQGYADAQYNLGICYHLGQGVKQNYQQAAIYFEKAAKQAHIAAQYNLGAYYENGQGVPQNYQTAIIWYTKAALQGEELSLFRLQDLKQRGFM